MDELMDLDLDPPSFDGKGSRVFAASHACVCNALKKPHYPKNWIHANCAFTTQHKDPDAAQKAGPSPTAGLGMPNGGLQVVNPSKTVYDLILQRLATSTAVESYDFADQSLLSDAFWGRWVPIPYIYNALKTMAWPETHEEIWQDDQIKNIHYLLSPKPWEEKPGEEIYPTHRWWWTYNLERLAHEKGNGIMDDF
ncbi:MAG: hypothetical protein Q9214_003114 [Letrouitia sp. 1 TL-2023]